MGEHTSASAVAVEIADAAAIPERPNNDDDDVLIESQLPAVLHAVSLESCDLAFDRRIRYRCSSSDQRRGIEAGECDYRLQLLQKSARHVGRTFWAIFFDFVMATKFANFVLRQMMWTKTPRLTRQLIHMITLEQFLRTNVERQISFTLIHVIIEKIKRCHIHRFCN